jgi:tetratricopeptide (TPR) repeat protein
VDAAKQEFTLLVQSDDRVLQLVGQSSIALADSQVQPALASALAATTIIRERDADPNQAPAMVASSLPDASPVPADPGLRLRDFHAHYQLGLVKARQEDWTGSAEALARASQLNPAFAYAHYYAGMAYSRLRRTDRVALHLEWFMRLAPTAPERTAVLAILRTIRG